MKIICTKAEKEQIKLTLMDSVNCCPFDKTTPVVCNGSHYCKECIEHNIEWEITDEP